MSQKPQQSKYSYERPCADCRKLTDPLYLGGTGICLSCWQASLSKEDRRLVRKSKKGKNVKGYNVRVESDPTPANDPAICKGAICRKCGGEFPSYYLSAGLCECCRGDVMPDEPDEQPIPAIVFDSQWRLRKLELAMMLTGLEEAAGLTGIEKKALLWGYSADPNPLAMEDWEIKRLLASVRSKLKGAGLKVPKPLRGKDCVVRECNPAIFEILVENPVTGAYRRVEADATGDDGDDDLGSVLRRAREAKRRELRRQAEQN